MALMIVGIGYFAAVTGSIAQRFVERAQEEHIEAIEAEAAGDLGARIDRLALRASEMASELEALRLAVTTTAARTDH
jgi:hypothetical protein